MWPFKRCVDCKHLCTGKCEVCTKPLCFECAGGIFQLHGHSLGFGKCKACRDEMDRQAWSAFPLEYKSPYSPLQGRVTQETYEALKPMIPERPERPTWNTMLFADPEHGNGA